MLVSTSPVVVTISEFEFESIADAPASVYILPNSTVTGLSPLIVITGNNESSSLVSSSSKIWYKRAAPPIARAILIASISK